VKILFDQGVPRPLRRYLAGHLINTTAERGWSTLENGVLLDRAEEDGYQLLITTDQSLRHQQNFAGRKIAILVLLSTAWPLIQLRVKEIQAAVNGMTPGDYKEISI